MQLGVERHVTLTRTKAPCGHSFKNCIYNYMAKNLGCTLLGNKHELALPQCKTMNEIRNFETAFEKITYYYNKEFRNFLGCLPPCTYMRYTVLDKQKISPQFGFQLMFAARELTIVKEVRFLDLIILQEQEASES